MLFFTFYFKVDNKFAKIKIKCPWTQKIESHLERKTLE